MTLEDFFTLTEMKDGLTAPSRVQELVTVMQKEQDSVAKNTGDAMRHWAAVASTIAATENKECLDLFIQLDGPWFINRWLNDAQSFAVDTNDDSIEESITAMLRAVEKLYQDREKSISSGVWVTVSNLLGHHSSKVQDRARVLFDKWKGIGNGNVESHGTNIGGTKNVSDKNLREEGQLSPASEAGNHDDHVSQLVAGEKSLLRRSDSQLQTKVANVQTDTSDNAHHSSESLDYEDNNERSNQLACVLTYAQGSTPMSEGEMASSGSCNLLVAKEGSFKGQLDDLQLNELSIKEKQDQNDNCPPEKLGAPDISVAPLKLESRSVSIDASESPVKPEPALIMPEPALEHNVESNEDGICHKIIASCSMRTPASDRMSGVDDAKAIDSSNPQLSTTLENDDDCCSNILVRAIQLEKPEVLEKSFIETEDVAEVKEEGKGQVSSQVNGSTDGSDSFKQSKALRSPNTIDKSSAFELEYGFVDALEVARQVAQEVERKYFRAVKEDKDQVSNQDDDTSNSSDSFKQGTDSKSPNTVDKNSDLELEYGLVDALEVARQVAEEVEREVHTSSSEKISESGIRQAGSSDSIRKNDILACVLPDRVSSRQSISAEACSEERHMSLSDYSEARPECIPDLESSQVTEAAQDPGGYSEKSLCTFDLNEEIGSDDIDVSANTMSTTPIPVVSASKLAQTSGLPTTPLQFEGTLGWKGSAATSAFRPASPRKNSESEKNASVSGNSGILKQKRDRLDIDLNVAEDEEELMQQIGESSRLPSGKSLVEHSPKRLRMFQLDLNSVGDDDDTQPSGQRMQGQPFSGSNGYWSPSPASSSTSMQPLVRNIDLNDRPYFQTELVDQRPTKSTTIIETYGLSKSDAPVISILGAKVEVGRKEYVPQKWSLPNGKAIEPAMNSTVLSGAVGVSGPGPTVSYNHSAVFGYSGLPSVPPLAFSSATYGLGGTIPYMVDSRGASVGPQLGESSTNVLPSYAPFIMGMAGTQPGLNGVGLSRPNFDLNSSFFIDGGNSEALAARPFFFPAQGRAMEEHGRTLPQSSSSGVGGKRKEPDSGKETLREKKDKERSELRDLVGKNLHVLSQIEGVDLETYKDTVLPSVLEQVVNSKDELAQFYLLERIIQVYPDEYHLQTLETLLGAFPQLQPTADIKSLLSQLMDRFSKYAASSTEVLPKFLQVEAFTKLSTAISRVTEGRLDLPIVGVIALHVSLLTFALRVHPDRLDYVDLVLGSCVKKLTGKSKLDDNRATKQVVELLSAPLDKYNDVMTALKLSNYPRVMDHLDNKENKVMAMLIVESIMKNNTCISTADKVEVLFELIKGLIMDVDEVDGEDFSEQQNSVSRLINMFHNNDPEEMFKIICTVKKHIMSGGPRHLPFTVPSLTFSALRLIRQLQGQNGEVAGEEIPATPRKIFQLLNETVEALSSVSSPELALRLYLHCAKAANDCDLEPVAYEFFTLAFVLYEEEIVDSKAQVTAIHLIIGTLQRMNVFGAENRDTLTHKATGYSAKLLKKPDQCRAVCACSHLFWVDDQDGVKDGERVLLCLKRALRIANASQQMANAARGSSDQVTLYVEILNKYIYYFEKGNPQITSANIEELIELIKTEMQSDSASSLQASDAFFNNTLRYIQTQKQKGGALGEKYDSIKV